MNLYRFLSVFLITSLVFGLSLFLPNILTASTPDGTGSNPWEVYTLEDLQNIGSGTDGWDLSDHYILMNDINASSTQTWNETATPGVYAGFEPIGDNTISGKFEGSFDGGGYEISNLYINRSGESQVGLFGVISNGSEVGNIGMINVEITGGFTTGSLIGLTSGSGTDTFVFGSYSTGNVTGTTFVGGLIGSNDGGQIADSYSQAIVNGSGGGVGGLSGGNYANHIPISVTNSYATGDVTGGGSGVGGLVGDSDAGEIVSSYATGNVLGDGNTGGLIGSVGSNDISDSYATGDVVGNFTGGLIGSTLDHGILRNSYAEGSVEGTGDTGGLIGYNNMTIIDSYTTGPVYGSGNNVGGLVGQSQGGTISNSYAIGGVEGGGDSIGGLIGQSQGGEVSDSYAAGNVTGSGWGVGGLIGQNGAPLIKSYALGDVDNLASDSWGSPVGGLVGDNYNPVTNSFFRGTVTGAEPVGGLAGKNSTNISNSYAVAVVNGSGSDVGGLVGNNSSSDNSTSFWDTDIGLTTSAGNEIGKTTAEMQEAITFTGAGWDMEENTTDLNDGYPYLSWQLESASTVWYIATPLVIEPETPTPPSPSSSSGGSSQIGSFLPINLNLMAFPENAGSIINHTERFHYYPQSQIKLTANNFEGYEFIQWAGDLDYLSSDEKTDQEITITLPSKDIEIMALFGSLKEDEPDVFKTSFYRNLTLGSTGGDVLNLQKFLNWLNFPLAQSGPGSPGSETNYFGGLTQGALARFQAANNISPAVGYFGPITRSHINNMDNVSNQGQGEITPAIGNLTLEMTGEDVRLLQNLLIKLDYSIPAGATAYFGPQTESALISFQVDNDISPASGLFDQVTRDKMKTMDLSDLWW